MATSGSVDFNQTRDQLITTAYKKVGLIQKGETPTADEISYASDILNLEVKALGAINPHIWKRRIGYFFPEKDKFAYNIGNQSADDNAFNSYVTTTTTAAAAATDTTLTVSSITGISNGDIIGLTLDAGTIHWTTVNGAPSGSTITLTDAVPSAAAIGSRVYVGSGKITRPVKVYNYWSEVINSDDTITRRPLLNIAYDDYYLRYGSQSTSSTPTQAMFDNRAVDGSTTLNHGVINIQPSGNQAQEKQAIGFVYETQIEDFDAATDNPDFPSEWLKLLMLGVCMGLLTSDGVPERVANRVTMEYDKTMDLLLQNDSDDSTFYIEPSFEEQQGYSD